MTTIKKNIGFSFITASSKLFGGIGVLIVLAHFLSLSDFGLFTYILTITSSIILFVDYGFNIKLLIDIPRNPNKIEELISTSISIKCWFFFIASIFSLIFYSIGLVQTDQIILTICIFFSLFIFSLNNTFLSLFKSTNNYLLETKIVFLDNILLFALILLTVLFTEGLYCIGVAFLVVKLISFLFSLYHFNNQFSFIHISFKKQLEEVKTGFPFAIHYIIGNFFLNLDTLILAYFVSQEDLGLYQSGVRLIIGTGILLTIVNSIYLPLLSKETHLINRAKELNFYLLSLGCLIAFPFLFFPEYVISIIYGNEFLVAVDLYRIFGIIIFLRIIGSSYGIVLSVSKKQIYRAIALMGSILLMFVLDTYFIPRSNDKLLVAAYVLLLSHIVITSIYIFISYKRYKTFFIPSFKFIVQKISSLR